MKALIYDGPAQLAFRDAPDPVQREGELLIRVDSVGICGSDMHAYLGHDERRPAPLILGHEAAGIITGGDRDGERVTINPLVTCGTCNVCRSGRENLCANRQIISMPPREGAFAEWVSMPPQNLVTVPDHVPLNKAALAEPLACGWHGVRLGLRAIDGEIDTAMVLGGGAIGLGAALALRAQDLTNITIVEPNDLRRAYLEKMTDFNVVAQPPEAPGLFDIVIDGVGYAATRDAASAQVRPGGVIVHIGLGQARDGLDIRRMTLQEITFIGTYAYTAEDFRQTAAAIFESRLGPLDWTEQRALKDGGQAFQDIRAGQTASPKLILTPSA